jgi:protein-S-isoprenylcysteine O-methyltransferase Ste14
MNNGLQIVLIFTCLYGIFELLMGFKQRIKSRIKRSGDKLSIWTIIVFIFLGYLISFTFASTRIGKIYCGSTFIVVGVVLVIIGLILRLNAIFTLRNKFTYTVTRLENHELIEKGLYKTIRHPGYLGQLIIFLGISTSLSNWLSILFMMMFVLIGYHYRIITEENFLIKQMGDQYLEYQKRTKKLIPKIY